VTTRPPYDNDVTLRTCARIDVGDPDNAIRLTKAGLLWDTPLFGVSFDAIFSGLVKLEDCVNVPDDMRAFIEANR